MKTPPVLTAISRHLSGQAQSDSGPRPAAAAAGLPVFSPGQTLRAVVVAVGAENRFTLEAGGHRFMVQSNLPLASGQTLDVQVLSTEPDIELQMTGNPVNRYFSRSLPAAGSSPDLASLFSLLQEAASSRPASLGSTSFQTLQQFALLQQNAVPGQEGGIAPGGILRLATPTDDAGAEVMQRLLTRAGGLIEQLLAEGRGRETLGVMKSTLADAALLIQDKAPFAQADFSRLERLSPASRQLFEILSSLRQTGSAGKETNDTMFNRWFDQLQLGAEPLLSSAGMGKALQVLSSALSDLAFLFRGPEGLARPAAVDNPQSGLPGRAAEATPFPQGQAAGSGQTGGELLQQLVNRLGLNLESLLAAGKIDEAVKSVKFAVLEMLQSFTEPGRLVESGRQTLAAIEFLQLAQLQTIRQDALVLPLPLPFLDEGYLLIEDYGEQSGEDAGTRGMPRRYSLLLRLTPLGNLRIDFLYGENGVYLRFNCASREVLEYFASMQAELEEALTSTAVQGVSFTENSEAPLSALLRTIRAGTDSLINTNA